VWRRCPNEQTDSPWQEIRNTQTPKYPTKSQLPTPKPASEGPQGGHANCQPSLCFSGNTIEYKYGDAIRLLNVNGAVIKNNTIAPAPNADPGKKAVNLTRCENTEQAENR